MGLMGLGWVMATRRRHSFNDPTDFWGWDEKRMQKGDPPGGGRQPCLAAPMPTREDAMHVADSRDDG